LLSSHKINNNNQNKQGTTANKQIIYLST